MALGKFQENRSWIISGSITTVVGLWLLSGQFGNSGDEVALPSAAANSATTGNTKARSSVRTRTQSAEEVRRTIVVNGKTAPARVVELSAETDGRVVYIAAERGSNVDRGAAIVQLDERDRSARLAEAEATVRQREVEFEARDKLKTESYVSEAQLQEAIAALEGARTELTRAKLDLSYMTVRAPFDGALQSRVVEQGDFVKRGDAIANFVDNRRIIVSANLSEFDARFVKVGDAAEAHLATGETVYGHIRYIAPVADEATRTFQVELEVDNSAGELRAGGSAELRIPAERVMAHRVSPSLLTLDDAGNVGIKIVDDAGKVRFVVADIALSSEAGVWIAGLPSTATIITVGQGFVAAGALVNAVPENEVETAVAIKSASE